MAAEYKGVHVPHLSILYAWPLPCLKVSGSDLLPPFSCRPSRLRNVRALAGCAVEPPNPCTGPEPSLWRETANTTGILSETRKGKPAEHMQQYLLSELARLTCVLIQRIAASTIGLMDSAPSPVTCT
jgi:hypothetical protein